MSDRLLRAHRNKSRETPEAHSLQCTPRRICRSYPTPQTHRAPSMTESTVVFTKETNSAAAGEDLGARLREGLSDHAPDAVIIFASSQHDYVSLLQAIHKSCAPGVLVGCSSAGEFISGDRGEGSASAVGIRSDVMRFTAGLGRNLRADRAAVSTPTERRSCSPTRSPAIPMTSSSS
jgi:hypothetical protein